MQCMPCGHCAVTMTASSVRSTKIASRQRLRAETACELHNRLARLGHALRNLAMRTVGARSMQAHHDNLLVFRSRYVWLCISLMINQRDRRRGCFSRCLHIKCAFHDKKMRLLRQRQVIASQKRQVNAKDGAFSDRAAHGGQMKHRSQNVTATRELRVLPTSESGEVRSSVNFHIFEISRHWRQVMKDDHGRSGGTWIHIIQHACMSKGVMTSIDCECTGVSKFIHSWSRRRIHRMQTLNAPAGRVANSISLHSRSLQTTG